MIRIGIDARELLGARTGVGRYLGELVTRWVERPDAHARELVLYSPEPLALDLAGTRVQILGGGRGTWWEQTTLAMAVRRDPPDVFFAPAYTAPLRLRAPLAVTIHDVSFSRHPEWFRPRERYRRHLLTSCAARRARSIIAVSGFSKQEIAAVYGVEPSRIEVICNGFTPRPRVEGIAREPLVLFTGSIFNRRRVPELMAAFAIVRRSVPDARLVVAGSNRTWPPQDLHAIATGLGIADRLTIRDYVTDAELDALYARASAFAFLSEYEGFGFTPLEALAAGVPVVVLDTAVAREIYGDAAAYVAAGNVAAAADALTRMLTSPDVVAAQLARATEVVSRYSWDTTAKRTLAAIERIARQ